MAQQRRTLSGMVNGLPVAVPAGPATVVVHQLDPAPTGDNNGRPFLNVVTLFAQNADPANDATLTVTLDPPTGLTATFIFIVPAGGVLQLFDEQPFGGPAGAPNGSAVISASIGAGLEADCNVWGWFAAN